MLRPRIRKDPRACALAVAYPCKQLAQGKSAGQSLRIAFNASARLLNIGLKEIVMGAIARSGIFPSDLEMELTETVVISNPNEAHHRVPDSPQPGQQHTLDTLLGRTSA